jgi:hydroxymethylglutaryl-CoA synthase
MIEYASAAIFKREWRGLPRWKDIETDIGKEPNSHNCEDREKRLALDAEFARRFAKSRQFLKAFNAKVKDTAAISRRVGNIYTGSIYLGLASLMELGKIRPGERLCFGAYGSGCSALVFSGISAAGSACCAFHEYLGKAGKEKADITG